ncbi:MAG: FhaA domain-containing protein [Acidimicrobiia bacterium]
MSVVRSLERRLERLLEGVAGRVFSGRLHPTEIAGKLAREADFARFETEAGPATANSFTILVHPRDLTLGPEELETVLAAEMYKYTAEHGLRLEGPVKVSIQASDDVVAGNVTCHVEVDPGPPVIWARLSSQEDTLDVGRNRVIIGRSTEADVVMPHRDVSRSHALLWREGGKTWVRDLDSANGTSVDGESSGQNAVEVHMGSVLAFSNHGYRFTEI